MLEDESLECSVLIASLLPVLFTFTSRSAQVVAHGFGVSGVWLLLREFAYLWTYSSAPMTLPRRTFGTLNPILGTLPMLDATLRPWSIVLNVGRCRIRSYRTEDGLHDFEFVSLVSDMNLVVTVSFEILAKEKNIDK